MLSAGIDLEVTELCATERSAWQHPLNRETDKIFRVTIANLRSGRALETTYITGVAMIHLITPLVAGEVNLLSVDYDDIVTVVYVRGKGRLVLTTKNMSDL